MSTDTISLNTDEERVSFGFGMQFGQQFLRNQFEGLDLELVIAGMRSVVENKPVALNEAEMQAAFDAINAKRKAEADAQAANMGKLSADYLAENAKRDGVTSLDSGVQYEVLEQGSGAVPTSSDTVRVHYEGTLINGQVFDSSIKRGEPIDFGVTQVIAGWTEVLQLMAVGSKWRVAIPADKAYGAAGSPPVIPANAALVFEVHLLDIV